MQYKQELRRARTLWKATAAPWRRAVEKKLAHAPFYHSIKLEAWGFQSTNDLREVIMIDLPSEPPIFDTFYPRDIECTIQVYGADSSKTRIKTTGLLYKTHGTQLAGRQKFQRSRIGLSIVFVAALCAYSDVLVYNVTETFKKIVFHVANDSYFMCSLPCSI